ncbi:MAG: amidase [Thalassobaculales bacterium]
MHTIASAAAALAAGRTTSRALVEAALARAEAGEGPRAFLKLHRDAALAAAEASDTLRRHAIVPSPLAGLPVSIKDLFDIAGEPTPAGSRVLADAPPATADAVAVARLRAAGAIVIGRTNMSEFAYSGVGYNPHHGTPLAPWDRATGRVPGGSSSGAAVSVADGMAFMGLGTDTGGSVRIPAALCGIAGFKPTARRVPQEGCFPLSPSLDSIGPLAASLACCALTDAVLAGEAPVVPPALPVAGLRLLVPTTTLLDGLSPAVAAAFAQALSRLSGLGARIVEAPLPALGLIAEINRLGGFAAAESYHHHRALLARAGNGYDQRVRARILRGAEQSAVDYLEIVALRRRLIAEVEGLLAPFDAFIGPTCPIQAPALAEVADDDGFTRNNLLLLRNTQVVNMIDGCSATLPIGPSIGLMISGPAMADRHILAVGLGIEAALARGMAA